jgi:N-acetylglucosaminyldiphosphoundecaprenol N-acetyl-beta-D-mannosaminyltransferase
MRESILGIPFDLIDYRTAIRQIDWWRRSGQHRYVTLTNAHGVVLSRRDGQLRAALRGADLVLPDGVSIVMAATLLRAAHQGRVTGPSLMLQLCQWGVQRGYRHYFYGGADGVAQRLAERLSAAYPGLQVAGIYSPPFRQLTDDQERQIAEQINDSKPDIVWVGLGAPKQEKWMARQVGRMACAAMIGVGAAFDFHSGNVRWAPASIRALGMEWAFRLAMEPRRMWQRNVNNALFVARVLGQAIGQQLGREPQLEPSAMALERPSLIRLDSFRPSARTAVGGAAGTGDRAAGDKRRVA